MKRLAVAIALFLAPLCAFAQTTGAVQGFATQGGVPAKTSGLNSTNTLQGVIPGATITVYLHGTTTLATIYKDGNNTPLSNPFTANAANVTNPGGWIFWAATSQGLDIFGSGGVCPNCYSVSTALAVAVYPSTAITVVTGVLSFNGRTGAVNLTTADVNGVGTISNNTTGNSNTASALAALPTPCTAGEAPLGILANGNSTGCFTPAGGMTQLTSDVTAGPGSGSQAATVNGLKSVPFCTGYTPTNGQAVTLTTASSPNPCYTAVTPASAGITALTGDVGAGPGSGSQAATLATVNSNIGACGDATHVGQVTLNAKGLTTGCTPVSITSSGSGITALTGDVTASGPGSAAATLATVNVSPGSYTTANITVNAKGLITSASNGSGGGGSSSIAPILVQWNCATIIAAVSPCVLGTGSAIATLSNTTAGSCILVKAFHGNGSAGSAVPTDGQSNVYTLYNYQQITGEFDFYEWVATNIAGGPLTVTITGDTPINVMVVEEIVNCGGVDVYSSAQASPSNPPSYTLSTGSATTTTTYDLIDVAGAIRNGSGLGTFSETNGYTSTITNLAEGVALVYNGWTGIAPTTGSLSDTLTFTGTVGAMYSSFIAFAPRVAVGAVTASAPIVATPTGKNVNLTCPACVGSAANYFNIGPSVTASGCTMSGSAPYVCTVGGGGASSITLSSIPGAYLNLEIAIFGTNTSGSAQQVRLQFNGDSGLNYDWSTVYAYASAGPAKLTGNGDSSASGCMTGQGSFGGGGTILIPQYANTHFYKIYNSPCGADQASSIYQYVWTAAGSWRNTAAITSVTLTSNSGNFSANDTVTIYGTN